MKMGRKILVRYKLLVLLCSSHILIPCMTKLGIACEFRTCLVGKLLTNCGRL